MKNKKTGLSHCVKSVRIRSYSDPHFPTFGLKTEYLSVFSPNAGKIRAGITSNTDSFYAVPIVLLLMFYFYRNTEIYSVNLRIQSKCEKIQIRKIPNTGTFNVVQISRKISYKYFGKSKFDIEEFRL